VQVFSQYKIVVFGAGLESTTHPDFAGAKSIVEQIYENTLVYGYISVRDNDMNTLKGLIDSWNSNYDGKIAGIFMDDFGFDFSNTRERMEELIAYCRSPSVNLGFILNAFFVDDVFLNSSIVLSGNREFYLFESFGITEGNEYSCTLNQVGFELFVQKVQKVLNYNIQQFTLAVTTNDSSNGFDQDLFNRYYYMCELMGYAGFSWSEYLFSSVANPTLTMRNFTGIINPPPLVPAPRRTQVKKSTAADLLRSIVLFAGSLIIVSRILKEN